MMKKSLILLDKSYAWWRHHRSATFHYWIFSPLLEGKLTKTYLSTWHIHSFSPFEQSPRSPKHLHSYPPAVLKHLNIGRFLHIIFNYKIFKECIFAPGARSRVAGVRPQVTLVDVDAGLAEREGGILVAGEPGLALAVMPGKSAQVLLK